MGCGWMGQEVCEQANRLTRQATDKKPKELLSNWIIRNNKVTFVQYVLYSCSASLHPGVLMDTSEYNAGVTPRGCRNTPSRFLAFCEVKL